MSKKKKKKYKVKNKAVIIVALVLVFIIVGVGAIIFYKFYQDDALKTLKKNYNEYIITTKKTNLYDINHKKAGSIIKNYYLELDKVKNLTLKNKYLKIKDTNYYIFYKDIKKTKKKEIKETTNDSYYLDLNKTIKTNKYVNLLKDNKKIITLNNGMSAKLKSIDDNYYYINFLNDNFQIKKDKNIKVIDSKDKKDNSYISVILYNQINENCNNDTCFHPNSIISHIKRLKKDKYYFITLDDYLNYLKGYVNLKEKAVLLLTNDNNNYLKKIEDSEKVKLISIKDNKDLKFTNSNKKSTRSDKLDSINNYYPKKYMVIDEYLKMAKGEDVIDDPNQPVATAIAVPNYHFFYDAKTEWCDETICLDTAKFEEHLKWLKDNGYKTLTINEFADWKDGYIELPPKSVLLTVDDGAFGTGKHNGNKLIPLLEKYQEYATLFLVTGWWALDNYKSDYLDVQSHTHTLHVEASCPDGRGKVACSDYQTVKDDLSQSITTLKNDNTSFCFPFYSYDNESIQAIKDLGFRIAFIGESRKATRGQNNYLITRYPIYSFTTLQEFINIVK